MMKKDAAWEWAAFFYAPGGTVWKAGTVMLHLARDLSEIRMRFG